MKPSKLLDESREIPAVEGVKSIYLMCPKKHDLIVKYAKEWTCDICKGYYRNMKTLLCYQCDYTVCYKCEHRALSTVESAPKPVTLVEKVVKKRQRDNSFFPGMLIELDMDEVDHPNYASSFLPVTILSINDEGMCKVGIQFYSSSRRYKHWTVSMDCLYIPRGPSFLDTFKVGELVEVRYYEIVDDNVADSPIISWWRAHIIAAPLNPRISDFYTVEFTATFTEESPTARVQGSCIRKATVLNSDSVKKNKIVIR